MLRQACLLSCLLACLFLLTSPTHADEDEIYQRLEQRWFDVEVIIFERLDQFDFNNVEQLTSTTPPRWSNHMVEYAEPSDPALDLTPPTRPLNYPSIFCIGFPLLPEALTPHPVVAAWERAAEQALIEEALRLEQAQLKAQNLAAAPGATPGVVDPEVDTAPTLANADDVPLRPPADDPTETPTQDPPTVSSEDSVLLMPEALADPLLAPADLEAQSEATTPIISVPPTPQEAFAARLAAFEAELVQASFVWTPATTMDAAVRAINRQQNLRPLFHRRWRQATPPRDAPVAIRIDLPVTEARLHGTLDVTVARYLHFNVDLWYEDTTLGQSPRLFSADGTSRAPDLERRYIHISERRRMRSREVHYLDHPKVGIVIRIDPLNVPEGLLADYSALEGKAPN